MQNGQSFTAALTTDIDAGKIVAGAVVGAVVGGTLGAAAPALTTYGTVAVAQVQTTAVAAAAAHPTAAAAVGGLVETAVECSMTGGGCGAADYAVGALTAGVSHRLSSPGGGGSSTGNQGIRGAAPGLGDSGGPNAGHSITPGQRSADLQINRSANQNGNYWCTNCGYENSNSSHFDIDHIVPKSQGGNNNSSNRRVLCIGCNRSSQEGWPPRSGSEWADKHPDWDMRR